MKNREIYVKDPDKNLLLNNGVATVTDEQTTEELRTLRYELETFVCEGEYAKGLKRILETYLTNLDRPEQPALGNNPPPSLHTAWARSTHSSRC